MMCEFSWLGSGPVLASCTPCTGVGLTPSRWEGGREGGGVSRPAAERALYRAKPRRPTVHCSPRLSGERIASSETPGLLPTMVHNDREKAAEQLNSFKQAAAKVGHLNSFTYIGSHCMH